MDKTFVDCFSKQEEAGRMWGKTGGGLVMIPDKGMTLINVELEERAPRINIPPIGKTLVHLGG